jgi:hypothetical protein
MLLEGGRGALHPRPPSLFRGQRNSIEETDMRAEIENIVDEIKQAISLLRRHL